MRNRDPPAAHRRLGRLERNAIHARQPGDGLGIFQAQLDRLGLLAFLFQQQAVALGRVADDSRRLAGQRRGDHPRIGQPQRDRVPALGQEFDPQRGLYPHHVLLDRRFAGDIGDQSAGGRFRLGGRLGFFPGRPPKLLELLVGQEHPAALLLEDLAQLRVGNINVLLADRAVRLVAARAVAGRVLGRAVDGGR